MTCTDGQVVHHRARRVVPKWSPPSHAGLSRKHQLETGNATARPGAFTHRQVMARSPPGNGKSRTYVWLMDGTASERSYAPLTEAHLRRLGDLADQDHRKFTRSDGRPEYRDRRVAVVLAQGAALHFVNKKNGVKDLDVWTFYAAFLETSFRFGQRKVHVDFACLSTGATITHPALSTRS
jgi:hypothetical protein